MKLSSQAISEFQEIYLNLYGVKLTEEEANEKAVSFLNFFKLIYRPIPKKDEALMYGVKELQ